MSLESMPKSKNTIEIPQEAVIVLDFDDTLFDSNALKRLFFGRLASELWKDTEYIKRVYQQSKGLVDRNWFERFIELLDLSQEKVLSILEEIITSQPSGLIFEDAKNFMKKAKSLGHQVVILTAGPRDFQITKIKAAFKKAGINFKEGDIDIIVVTSKEDKIPKLKERASASWKAIMFFDDRLPQWVSSINGLVPVLVAREGVETQGDELAGARISSFKQVKFRQGWPEWSTASSLGRVLS